MLISEWHFEKNPLFYMSAFHGAAIRWFAENYI
jgi:hypothetical protein